MLIAALAKYWRPIDEEYYFYKMDQVMTANAIRLSGFPEHVIEMIEEKEKPTGSMVYKKGHLKPKYRG